MTLREGSCRGVHGLTMSIYEKYEKDFLMNDLRDYH